MSSKFDDALSIALFIAVTVCILFLVANLAGCSVKVCECSTAKDKYHITDRNSTDVEFLIGIPKER